MAVLIAIWLLPSESSTRAEIANDANSKLRKRSNRGITTAEMGDIAESMQKFMIIDINSDILSFHIY